MSQIPLAREILEELLRKFDGVSKVTIKASIMVAIDLMHREKPVRKARHKSRRMTAELGHKARAMAKNRPDLTLQEIGEELEISMGRVSEALHGRWK